MEIKPARASRGSYCALHLYRPGVLTAISTLTPSPSLFSPLVHLADNCEGRQDFELREQPLFELSGEIGAGTCPPGMPQVVEGAQGE